MITYEDVKEQKEKVSLIGLGYVGMPIAVAFAKKADVIGFDISDEKIKLYQQGTDPTKEVGNDEIRNTTVTFTSNPKALRNAKFHIVAVPTPINSDHTPDLSALKSACKILGQHLAAGSIVVFESTVYPGVTEEICFSILEEESGLKCGQDFKVGYSPERINPGDKVHRFETIVKVVAGMDEESLHTIAKVYELVVDAGIHKAESIQVAEAAKVIENAQRDINIAFMNELSIIFNKINLDTNAVLEAAGTKWNFLKFTPGLVGGHCIGVDPYYLTYKAEQMGYHSQIILSGRKINDDMGKYIAENAVKQLIQADVKVKGANIAVFGATFKENTPDVRNSKVIDVINELNNEYGVHTLVIDPVADQDDLYHEYGIKGVKIEEIMNIDVIILAVPHDEFKSYSLKKYYELFKDQNKKVIIDVKGLFNRNEIDHTCRYWTL